MVLPEYMFYTIVFIKTITTLGTLLEKLTIRSNLVKVDMDGSASFTKNRGYQFLFLIGDAKERLITDEARQAGFGYEEVNHIMPHKKELYENNKCKNPTKLLGFVKKAVYLQPNEFNYMDINYDSKLI